MFVKPQPFEEAIAKLGARHPVTARLTSDEWRTVPVALRERAFFSSRVESARFLDLAKGALNDFLTGARETLPNGETVLKAGSRADFVKQMQDFATANGLGDALPGQGGKPESRAITNIRSSGRLALIFDTQIQAAHDYGYWKQGMDADVLDAFPAQKFIRVIAVKEPRLDHAPFEDKVALKTDVAFWVKINRDFNVPWGPWGWRCGHDVEDVGREEAEALGLLKPGQRVAPIDEPFNRALEASTRGLGSKALAWLKEVFGDQVYIDGDSIRWRHDPAPAKTAPPPTPKPKRAAPAFPKLITGLEIVRQLGGTTGAQLVRDPSTGKRYVLKRGASPDHIRAEFAADELYRAAGVRVPKAKLYETADGPAKLADYIEGETLAAIRARGDAAAIAKIHADLRKGFAADALLANWDVIGTDADNILVDKQGRAWRIDNGGSLQFRARGADKGADWNAFPTELWSMRDATAADAPRRNAFEVFGDLTIYDIAKQINAIDAEKLLAKAPPETRAILEARLANAADIARKAGEFQADRWRAAYADDVTREMMGLRHAGIVARFPKQLTQNPGSTDAVDEHGRTGDGFRTHATANANPADAYWNDLRAAAITVNKHGGGDGQFNQATLDKARAHKTQLEKLARGKDTGLKAMAKHYLDVLAKVEAAIASHQAGTFKKTAIFKQWVPAGSPAAPSQSVIADLRDHIAARGGDYAIVSNWASDQAGSSWNALAAAQKHFLAEQRDVPLDRYYWGSGQANAKSLLTRTVAQAGGDKYRRTWAIYHAFVQEALAHVDTRFNARDQRLVRIIRTEEKPVVRKLIKAADHLGVVTRGTNESGSLYHPYFYKGTEVTLQAVPHVRVTSIYWFERTPGSGGGLLAGDHENEITFMGEGITARWVGTRSNHDAQLDRTSDPSTWNLPLP